MGVYLFMMTVIIIYGYYRCLNPDYKDPLTHCVTGEYFTNYLDGWGISHFLFYMYLGYILPGAFWEAMSVGAVWEVMEWYSGSQKPFYMPEVMVKTDMIKDGSPWWYGRTEDLLMNAAGFQVGKYISPVKNNIFEGGSPNADTVLLVDENQAPPVTASA
jgi:hypothetical protein